MIKTKKQIVKKVKTLTKFRPVILSRHPSHDPLRESLPLNSFKSVIRFGSTTEKADTIEKGGNRIEINTVQSIRNSASKLLMKNCFQSANVKTAEWWTPTSLRKQSLSDLPYPIISKHIYGSRGRGNVKHNSPQELERFLSSGKTLSNYIFEKFTPYKLEYRFHTNINGCFYTCRKALKEDTPEDKRWCMNDSTCVWYNSENEKFLKPNSFDEIEKECIKALQSLGLDFCAFDIRVQSQKTESGKTRKFQDFFIVEGNSAPSLKELGLHHYNEQLPIILNLKWKQKK